MQAGLELVILLPPTSLILGLQKYATMISITILNCLAEAMLVERQKKKLLAL
jgi:hypothetical protein